MSDLCRKTALAVQEKTALPAALIAAGAETLHTNQALM